MRTSIGPYTVTGILGEGGMGIVYAARDERLGRMVALKMLKASEADPAARERLNREARSVARINHPATCQLYYVARTMAHLGAGDEALPMLSASVDDGFFCPPAYTRDPWLDSVRGRPEFVELVRRTEARHRQALIAFLTAEGNRVLGVAHPV